MGPKWRAPKRSNDKAWKQIASGDWLWELDPKRIDWDAKDFGHDKQNPKKYKNEIFSTLQERLDNSRTRHIHRTGHDYGR